MCTSECYFSVNHNCVCTRCKAVLASPVVFPVCHRINSPGLLLLLIFFFFFFFFLIIEHCLSWSFFFFFKHTQNVKGFHLLPLSHPRFLSPDREIMGYSLLR